MREQEQSQIGIGCVDGLRLEIGDFGADGAYVDDADLVDMNRGFESRYLHWLSAKSGFWVPRVQQGVAAEGGKAESASRS